MRSPEPAAPATILVVDDDPDFLLQEQLQLAAAGYAVLTASSRAEAEELLETARPDMAMVDLMMEAPDAGFTLCHHIKQKYPDMPVIMITAVTSETGLEFDAVTRGERSWVKADAILAKPVRFEQLQREVRRLLEPRTGAGGR
jgi:CheY-like chemotaxis protein